MAALGVIVVLLIVVGAAGLFALADANARSDRLVQLQRKTAAYEELRQSTTEQLSGVAAALADPAPRALETAVRQVNLATADVDRLEFVAADEREIVSDVRGLFADFSGAAARVLDLSRAGRSAEARDLYAREARPLADRIERRMNELVHRAEAETLDDIERSHEAFSASQRLIVGVAIGSVLLALALGIALALSVTRPLRRMGERLDRVAAGDFTAHVAIDNRDELGALARSINSMSDELARLYAQIRDADQRKSEFLANMSHELRTPLNAIIGFAGVLLQRMFGELNDKQDDYLRDIETSGKHLLAVVNDILDLSKIEAGMMELQPSVFSLEAVIESGATMIRERAAKGGVRVSVTVDPALGPIEADERKVKQVLFNLLSNAVKFTPSGGSIAVTAGRRDGEVRVAVRDTGPGIAAEDQARIFEEFQQTKTGAQTEESTGLGLTLAKRFIELHGGRLWVESEVGKGSTFTFALPYAPTTRV